MHHNCLTFFKLYKTDICSHANSIKLELKLKRFLSLLYLSNSSLTWKNVPDKRQRFHSCKMYPTSSSSLLLGLLERWKSKPRFRFQTPRLSLHAGNYRPCRSPKWVTQPTVGYINITGGHSGLEEEKKKKAAFKATLAVFHHAQKHCQERT